MSSENYRRTISVAATPEAAYWALTEGMHAWWTTPDAPMKAIGDRSTFTFPPGVGFWAFEAAVLEPARRVEMICVEALHRHDGKPKTIETEWLGTRVVWRITANGTGADIDLEHRGLVPTLHCYDICEQGWDFFFADSLKAFLDTGTGNPHSLAGATALRAT